MRKYDDVTDALRSILLQFTHSYTCWISFIINEEKETAIAQKWAEVYGTLLPAHHRRYRREKGLPCAWSCSAPVLSQPGKREVILLVDKFALDAPVGSPFKKEKWRTDLPTFSRFVISHDTDEFGKKAAKWTWRIQQQELSILEVHITALVKSFDAVAVAKETNHAVSFYPMFGGVRRQIKRMLRSTRKLWMASSKTPWPGADADNLPIMTYKKTTVSIR